MAERMFRRGNLPGCQRKAFDWSARDRALMGPTPYGGRRLPKLVGRPATWERCSHCSHTPRWTGLSATLALIWTMLSRSPKALKS